MTLRQWLDETWDNVREDGLAGARESAYQFYLGMWRRSGRIYNYGEHVYDREWDVLLVLDACRADLMAEVEDEYDWLEYGETTSVGGGSPEWIRKTFTEEYADEMAQTAYVTGNPFSDELLDPDDFLLLDEVWKYSWEYDIGTIVPRALTDRAIDVHREYDPRRMIVHYMQPHHPFVGNPLDTGINLNNPSEPNVTVWERIRKRDVDPDDAWEAYRDNLRYVLDDIEDVLCDNIDADRVVVTADHGNLFGEFGLYGHDDGIIVSDLKDVPWCTTTATDEGAYEPGVDHVEESSDAVNERLRDLGYRS